MCFMKTLYLLSIWNFRHLIHYSATDVFSTTLWASSLFFFFLTSMCCTMSQRHWINDFVFVCHNNFGTTSCVLKSVSLKPDLSTHILNYVVCSCTILTLDINHKPFHIMNVFTVHWLITKKIKVIFFPLTSMYFRF